MRLVFVGAAAPHACLDDAVQRAIDLAPTRLFVFGAAISALLRHAGTQSDVCDRAYLDAIASWALGDIDNTAPPTRGRAALTGCAVAVTQGAALGGIEHTTCAVEIFAGHIMAVVADALINPELTMSAQFVAYGGDELKVAGTATPITVCPGDVAAGGAVLLLDSAVAVVRAHFADGRTQNFPLAMPPPTATLTMKGQSP